MDGREHHRRSLAAKPTPYATYGATPAYNIVPRSVPRLVPLKAPLDTEKRSAMAIGQAHIRGALLCELYSRPEHLRKMGKFLFVGLPRLTRQ